MILCHESNHIQSVIVFKILNNVALSTFRFVTFNLNHKINLFQMKMILSIIREKEPTSAISLSPTHYSHDLLFQQPIKHCFSHVKNELILAK